MHLPKFHFSKNPELAVMYAFYPMVIITGFVQLLVPSTIHMIMQHFDLKAGGAGILPFIYFSGILTSALFITHLIKKYSVKKLMIVGAIIVSTTLIIVAQLESFTLFAILFFLIGFGNGTMIILPGIYSTHIFGKKNTQIQSVIFSFLALGYVVGPIFPGIISYLHLSWRWCFTIPGLVILPAIIPIVLAKHEPIDKAEKLTIRIFKQIVNFDSRFFIGIVIGITVGVGATSAILTWIITFLEEMRNATEGYAHLALSAMGVGSIIGRQMWSKLAVKITVYRTLLIIVPVAAVLIFIAPIPKSTFMVTSLFFTTIVFTSGINPLFLSAAGAYPKSHASSAFTILFICVSLGGILIPYGIGQLFQFTNPEIGIRSISGLFIIVTLALIYIRTEIPISEHINKHMLP